MRSGFSGLLVLLLVIVPVFASLPGGDLPYDHQTKTYTSHFQPISISNADLEITPFFSPDHSADSQTWLVTNASKFVDIGAPGWNSWAECAQQGCTPAQLRSTENFPLWCALLNALHRGVQVRILTNDYSTSTPPLGEGYIDPLTFLFLNGAQVRYFATVTFLHEKYLATESAASVSSVNFDYTSYMMNREAGVIIEGDDSAALRSFLDVVYQSDWNASVPFTPAQTYSSEEMHIITNTASVPVTIPPRRYINAYQSPLTTIRSTSMNASIFTSPDFAYDFITSALRQARHTVAVMIYQITDDMCDFIVNGSHSIEPDQWTILVSAKIFSETDYAAAQLCYESLVKHGFHVQQTSNVFSFSHQKFWLIDYGLGLPTTQLFLSTGNWGSTDFPHASVFPPYSQSGWADENRDFNFQTTDSSVMDIFYKVLQEDYSIGSTWRKTEQTTPPPVVSFRK